MEKKKKGGSVMLQRKDLLILAIILLILSFPLEGLAAPKFTIKPKVSAGGQVDSNFYKAEARDREVYTYILQPGIDLGVETPKGRLSLDYTMNDYSYEDKDTVPAGEQAADKEDYLGHTATLMARYRAFDRLLLGLDNSYYKTRDPAHADISSDPVDRDKYSINRLTPMGFYEFGPLSLGLRYRNTGTDYDIAAREDSTENRGMLDLVFNFTRLTSLDLEYQHWKRDYDRTSDYTSDQLKLIFRRQFKYFSFEAGGGRQERSFDKNLEDIDVFTYRIAIIGQNPPAPERPRSHITFAAEQNFNVAGAGDTYFTAHRFSLDAGHIFLEKILAGIEGYYQISDYETTAREDKTYDIAGGVGYMFTDWLTFSLTAGYEERDSNVAGYDYDNTYYMAKLDLVYNLGAR